MNLRIVDRTNRIKSPEEIKRENIKRVSDFISYTKTHLEMSMMEHLLWAVHGECNIYNEHTFIWKRQR